jgi:hypothetical protein
MQDLSDAVPDKHSNSQESYLAAAHFSTQENATLSVFCSKPCAGNTRSVIEEKSLYLCAFR